MNLLLICFAILFTGVSFSQDSLDAFYDASIEQGYENAQYDSVIIYALAWYKHAKKNNNDSIMPLALRYYLEGCFRQKKYKEGKKALEQLIPFTYSNATSVEFPKRLRHATMFTYLYFKSEYDIGEKKLDSAIVTLKNMIRFVEEHTEHYRFFSEKGDLSETYELAQFRLFQSYNRLGECYMEKKDYDNAHYAYMMSYKYGAETDSIFKEAYHLYYGNKSDAIRALLNYASVIHDPELFEKWNRLNTGEDQSKFKLVHTLHNGMHYLMHTKDGLDKSQNIIKHLLSTSFSNSDPSTLLTIIKYYLKINEHFRAKEELKKYISIIRPERENLTNKIDFHLIKAELNMLDSKWNSMHNEINKAQKWLQAIDLDTDQEVNGLKINTDQQITNIYIKAYNKNKDISIQQEVVKIAQTTLPELRKLKYIREQGEDHSIILRQSYLFLIQVLDAFFLLQSSGNEIDFNLLFQYFELNKSFNLQNEKLLKERLFSNSQKIRYNQIKLEIKKIENQINERQQVSEETMLKLPKLRSMRRTVIDSVIVPQIQPIGIKEAQEQLTEREVIIEYFVNEKSLYILKLEKNAMSYYKSEYQDSKSNLMAIIKKYRELTLVSHDSRHDSGWCQISHELYTHLLEPLGMQGKEKLIIIPDAELNLISFQALLTEPVVSNKYKTWPYLIKKYKISTQQSVRFWLEYNLGEEKNNDGRFYLFSPKMTDIKYHREECFSLFQQFKGTRNIHESTNSTKALAGLTEKGSILHIATHAQSDPIFESKTFIRASFDTLTADEIAYENFDEDLIFLSACETGVGEVIKEEGVFSLARSFFKAGAQSVISTFWKINDKISKEQVLRIYHYLSKGMKKDESIRQMQLDYINDADLPGKYAAPYFWAAYQCQGDLRPLLMLKEKNLIEKHFQSIVIVLLTLGLGFTLYVKRAV